MAKPLIKLNLGSGKNTGEFFEDWLNVDLLSHTNVDIVCRVEELNLPDNFADEIYASHILEHFGTHHVSFIIQEWIRVLKPGRRIRIAVPNIIFAFKTAEEYCHKFGYDGEYLAKALHGGQRGKTLEESISNSHRTAFDDKLLKKQAERGGIIVDSVKIGHLDDMKARHPDTFSEDSDLTPTDVFLIGHKRVT